MGFLLWSKWKRYSSEMTRFLWSGFNRENAMAIEGEKLWMVKWGMSWLTAEGNVAKGPSIVPYLIATGSRTRSPLPLSNFLSLLLGHQGVHLISHKRLSWLLDVLLKDSREGSGLCAIESSQGSHPFHSLFIKALLFQLS